MGDTSFRSRAETPASTLGPEAAPNDVLSVTELSLEGFRNLTPQSMTPGPRFNVLFGDNGAGKSSVLEALSYVSALESFRSAKKDDIIGRDVAQLRMVARLLTRPFPRTVRIGLSRSGTRQVEVDGKRPGSLGSYFGAFPSVLFHPGDVELMAGGPEPRRAFLDRVLAQIDAGYARRCFDYGKALRSRNRLLKGDRPDARSVIAYNGMLAELGAAIGSARAQLTAELKPNVEAYFSEITEHALPIDVTYAARTEPTVDALSRALSESYDRDVLRGYTGVGPHGDDLQIDVRRTLVKHFASQGQHRAIVLALKVAELSVLLRRTGRMPLLLLDDVSSELDRRRNRRFFQLLARLGGQVFLTTTHREFILIDEHRTDFSVEQGVISQAP